MKKSLTLQELIEKDMPKDFFLFILNNLDDLYKEQHRQRIISSNVKRTSQWMFEWDFDINSIYNFLKDKNREDIILWIDENYKLAFSCPHCKKIIEGIEES
jgi:hypothetical protein